MSMRDDLEALACECEAHGMTWVVDGHYLAREIRTILSKPEELATREQRLQQRVNLAGLELRDHRRDVAGVADLHRRAVDLVGVAGQRIEVIGEAVGHRAHVERHGAGRGQRQTAVDVERARRGPREYLTGGVQRQAA